MQRAKDYFDQVNGPAWWESPRGLAYRRRYFPDLAGGELVGKGGPGSGPPLGNQNARRPHGEAARPKKPRKPKKPRRPDQDADDRKPNPWRNPARPKPYQQTKPTGYDGHWSDHIDRDTQDKVVGLFHKLLAANAPGQVEFGSDSDIDPDRQQAIKDRAYEVWAKAFRNWAYWNMAHPRALKNYFQLHGWPAWLPSKPSAPFYSKPTSHLNDVDTVFDVIPALAMDLTDAINKATGKFGKDGRTNFFIEMQQLINQGGAPVEAYLDMLDEKVGLGGPRPGSGASATAAVNRGWQGLNVWSTAGDASDPYGIPDDWQSWSWSPRPVN
jgi:hypothetical protein